MAGLLRKWHVEHVWFGRVLDLLERQIAAFHAGEEPDYTLMRDIVYSLQDFGGRFHHPWEDVAVERVARRKPDMRMVVNRLLQEHRVIDRAGQELLGRLDEIIEDVIVERAAVEAAAGTYIVYYRHHIATEERDVLPSAGRFLTPEDWSAVEAAIPTGSDPLFGPDFEARYEELRRQIAPDTGAR